MQYRKLYSLDLDVALRVYLEDKVVCNFVYNLYL